MSFWTRFENAGDIPSSYFEQNKEIRAIVVSITDGDTIRVRHITTLNNSVEYDGKLSDHTIAVRFAAVDAPETAKFGKKGQPLGPVAKEFVTARLLNKKVTIQLLARDQFQRAVALVKYRDNVLLPNVLCRKKDISEQLLMAGMAAVYRQGGGQYGCKNTGNKIDPWNQIEQQAIVGKRGMWVNGEEGAELPSNYKRKST